MRRHVSSTTRRCGWISRGMRSRRWQTFGGWCFPSRAPVRRLSLSRKTSDREARPAGQRVRFRWRGSLADQDAVAVAVLIERGRGNIFALDVSYERRERRYRGLVIVPVGENDARRGADDFLDLATLFVCDVTKLSEVIQVAAGHQPVRVRMDLRRKPQDENPVGRRRAAANVFRKAHGDRSSIPRPELGWRRRAQACGDLAPRALRTLQRLAFADQPGDAVAEIARDGKAFCR